MADTDPFAALRAYDFGEPTDALLAIEQALKRPGLRAAALKELLRVLDSDATFAARQFACKKLCMVGAEIPAPVLEKLLASPDRNLVEAACYAISSRPAAESGRVLRQSLERAKGAALIAIVNLAGERRDAACVPALAPLAEDAGAGVAGAALSALGKIASPEAVRVLEERRAPHALLDAAQELSARGETDRARGILQRLMKLDAPPQVLRGAKAMAAALPADGAGFVPLFNGVDFSEWEIDTASVWSLRNGVIIGRSPGLAYNEFLRTKKHYGDFVLKAGLRLIDGIGNSGIQFRSKPVAGSHEVEGYQADAGERYWGALYDESRRRKVLAGPGAAFLEKFDPAAWHEYEVSARGGRIRIELDGVETVNYEEPEAGIARTGFIALQVHSARRPVEVWFRNLRIKTL